MSVAFGFTDEHLVLRDRALDFAKRELADASLAQRDRDGLFGTALWEKLSAFGLPGAIVPSELGGSGLSLFEACLMLEGLGQGCQDSGVLFAASAHLFAGLVPILDFGSPEQRAHWVPLLASGAYIAAHGMTETESGSDAFSLRTRAVRDGDHYVLSGTKAWVTNGPHCDLAVVFARTGEGAPLGSLSCFLVPRGTPGFGVGAAEDMLGLRTAPMSELVLQDCRVPADHRLGAEGSGALIFMSSMGWERIGILAAGLGVMARVLEASVDHARSRRVGGKSLSSFQAVSHRLVAMKGRVEAARLVLYQAAHDKDHKRAGAHAELAKLHVADALVETCRDAVAVHGAMGLSKELGLERDLRDALMSQAYSGTADVLRNLVARALGL